MERPSWFPDELPLAGSEHLDPEYAAGFDRKSGAWAEHDLERLVELGLDADSTLVDLGAGTGSLALLAAHLAGRVVAVEPSPAMLSILRDRAQGTLEIVDATFLTYEHTGPPADIVYSRNVLHHLPDFWKTVALRRIKTFLRPGGTFWLRDVVYAFEPAEIDSTLAAWFAAAPSDPAEGFTREDLEEHVREEHSTFSWLLEPMLEHAGFEIVERTFTPARTFASYVCRV